ncbi:hypothetical protein ACTFIR_012914, partial [Dictyostelium discoideum]
MVLIGTDGKDKAIGNGSIGKGKPKSIDIDSCDECTTSGKESNIEFKVYILNQQTEFVNNLVGTLAERTGIEVDVSPNTSNKRVLNEPPYIYHNGFYHHSNLNQKQKLNNTISAPQPKNYVIEAI